MQRYMLDRRIYKVDTSLGSVRVKVSSGYGTTRKKIEYEDLAKIAKEKGISLSEVEKIIQKDLNV